MNNKIEEKIKECEFSFVSEIKTSQIVFESSLRKSCEMNACGKFGCNYCCPPHVGKIEDCIAKAKSYEGGYIFQLVTQLDDPYDFEGMMAGQYIFKDKILQLGEKLYQSNISTESDLLILGAGPCSVCSECAIKRSEPCPTPERKIPSVESYGVFVNATLVNVGLKYNNGENTVSYCGMVLIGGNNNE